jgi:hypothetical protein
MQPSPTVRGRRCAPHRLTADFLGIYRVIPSTKALTLERALLMSEHQGS